MNYSVHSDARSELSAASAYYLDLDLQLGEEFLAEFEKTIHRVIANPEAWAEILPGVRRCLMHRFPYSVVYRIGVESITIVALAHLHRRPNYWAVRLS